MNNLVTLILILHNRHYNLDRQLDYYKSFTSPILIADSSTEQHQFKNQDISIKYLYTPGLTFTQKIERALEEVTTPYVVMCADDDFIIHDSIFSCVAFLEKNISYAIAQGSCIKYFKNSIYAKQVYFGLLYEVRSYDIEMDNPLERLEAMFDHYRSVLYAVHRTDILRFAFKNMGRVVKNLYLNEYLTAIVPIICGKYKELPVLYQVREYAEDSDDKTTDNLDVIFHDRKYKSEIDAFVGLLAEKVASVTSVDKEVACKKINDVLEKFSKSPLIGNHPKPLSIKKRIGLLIKNVPIIGKSLIEKNRRMEQQNDLSKIMHSENDYKNLASIEATLKKHTTGTSI